MSRRAIAELPVCPRCGQPARVFLDEPAGHQVRDMDTKEWKQAQACVKCVDEIRAGRGKRAKRRAANDNAPEPKRRMQQIELFEETTTKGSP